MKKVTSRKFVLLWSILCVIAILSALACSSSTPTPTPAPTTAKPAATTASVPPSTTAAPATKPVGPAPTAAAPTVSAAPSPSSTSQVQTGGTLNIIGTGIPSENLGYIATATPRWNPTLPWPCVERLIYWNNTGLFTGVLATDWKWSADALSLTLTIRKGVKFHDGTALDAKGVKYLLDLVKDSNRTELKSVSNIEVVDDYTVKINLKAFDSLLLSDLATTAGAMVSPTALQKFDMNYNVANPVGTGPFKFVSWQRDVNLKYSKNPDYWQPGKPYLDGVTFIFTADSRTARASFLAGDGQILGTGPSDAAELAKNGNYNIVSAVGPLVALAPDGKNADSPFNKLEVRQAVSYAIDINPMVKTLGYGYLIPTNQVATSGMWNYNKDVKGYPYDPKKAKDLLTKAGYPNGFKTTIYYETDYSDIAGACTAIQDSLRQIGIEATLQGNTMAKMTDIQTKGWNNGLVATRATIGMNYSPINSVKRNFSVQGTNYISVAHPDAFESLLKQAIAEPDQAKLTKIMQDLNKVMIDDYCTIIPLYSRATLYASYPKVKGAGWIMGDDFAGSAGDTWISK
jgi:peptide/nickel transport system substrate-binding protein